MMERPDRWLIEPSFGLDSGPRTGHLARPDLDLTALCGWTTEPPATVVSMDDYPQDPPGAVRCGDCSAVALEWQRGREAERAARADGGARTLRAPGGVGQPGVTAVSEAVWTTRCLGPWAQLGAASLLLFSGLLVGHALAREP